jgi:hypothetical protein
LSGGRVRFIAVPSHEVFLSKQDKRLFVKDGGEAQIATIKAFTLIRE